ncbi:MAG: 2,3-diphosphoglycerate-dependent phosphoglycerate mutase [Gammaproteobacteria bacterium]|nr:2,3-diphosphoglycerate-dependent phosphoglycerate mutase [Gammaproteobacteria bacterium]
MVKVVFLRHGQSTWNLENRFTGWTDVDLSPHGAAEAREAGRLLKTHGYDFDITYTSVLKRAIRTLWIVQEVMDLMWLPVEKDWRLNERHYGALQGLNKREMQEQYGGEQVHRWRRGYAVRPPALDGGDPRHPRFDPRYRRLDASLLPSTESLEDTLRRVLPSWEQVIKPRVANGERVLVSAHGNSLRALIKELEDISDDDITEVNVPTGIPLVYEFDEQLRVMTHYYLAEPAAVESALEEVKHQTTP